MKSKGIYELDFRVNLSVNYKINKYISVMIFGTNLLNSGNSKRYTYEAGDKLPNSYFRGGWVEEPMTFGLNMALNF